MTQPYIETERQRADRLARILATVLGEFRPQPGTSLAHAVIDVDTLQRWQALAAQPVLAAGDGRQS